MKGLNLLTFENALALVVSCELVVQPYASTCFGHLMSKCC